MRTKRILSLMLVILTLVVMPGCLGSRYQNTVDKSLLIQENLQLDQALSLSQYRLQIVEQENEQLRQRLGQGSQHNSRTSNTQSNNGQPTPIDIRQRSYTQPAMTPTLAPHLSPPAFQTSNDVQRQNGRNQTPDNRDTDIPGVTLPAPNQPGDVPAVFQSPQTQNRNRPSNNMGNFPNQPLQNSPTQMPITPHDSHPGASPNVLPLPQKVPSGRTPNEMSYRTHQLVVPLYLPREGDQLLYENGPQIIQTSGVSDAGIIETTPQASFPNWSPNR